MTVPDYSRQIKYLYSLQGRGMKFGLRNIRALLKSVGNPQNAYPSIHVAGTNGKGSTTCFLASMFMEGGYRTGLYTSPHLVSFTERIRIQGREITQNRLAKYVEVLRPSIESNRATFFEATTAIAFLYFADEGVDIALIETGLGGRLDSTNVVEPILSVITNIGLDHMEYLGPTIKQIAAEKAGIIKSKTPIVVGNVIPEAETVLRRTARRKQARFSRSHEVVDMTISSGGRVAFDAPGVHIKPAMLGLDGSYQRVNARLAVAAVRVLLDRPGFRRLFPRLGALAVQRGIEHVKKNTGLHGRLDAVGRVILDVAHNPDGLRTAVGSILESGVTNLTAVFGAMKDKAYLEMLRQLAWVAETVVVVQPHTPRAASAKRLHTAARRLGVRAVLGGTVANGLKLALGSKSRILVTGSHYVVGEAMEYLRTRKK
jgi:dihydrofolate synthase/folylpolyglutamate synthase